MNTNYYFEEPLQEGIILSRPNRFIMNVLLDGKTVEAHCPATGNISNIIFNAIPCLLSHHPERSAMARTSWTVEAISLSKPSAKNKKWLGINQNASNRYIEYFLKQNVFTKEIIKEKIKFLERERTLGESKLDFLVNQHIYLEVKTPLNVFAQDVAHVKYRPHLKLTDLSRFVRHLGTLTNQLRQSERAIVLQVHMFDAPVYEPPQDVDNGHNATRAAVQLALSAGLELWQVNLKITPNGVKFLRIYNLGEIYRNRL